MRVLGIIPARGGSKGIPRKNIKLLAGKPLLQYTAEAARGAVRLERTLLSTDDSEIVSVGEQLGLWVPFLRPAELARDETPTLPVLLHLAEWLTSQGQPFDAYCLLQPTSPLRTSREIDAALALLESSGADSVVSVMRVPSHWHPEWQIVLDETQRAHLWNGKPMNAIVPRRQMLSPTYIRTGAVYAMRHHTLTREHSLYGAHCAALVTDSIQVNLDTLEDWAVAEQLLGK